MIVVVLLSVPWGNPWGNPWANPWAKGDNDMIKKYPYS